MPDSEEQELNCKIVAGIVSIKSVDDFLSVLRELAQKYVVTIQAMDAELIAGEEHIKSAVQHPHQYQAAGGGGLAIEQQRADRSNRTRHKPGFGVGGIERQTDERPYYQRCQRKYANDQAKAGMRDFQGLQISIKLEEHRHVAKD